MGILDIFKSDSLTEALDKGFLEKEKKEKLSNKTSIRRTDHELAEFDDIRGMSFSDMDKGNNYGWATSSEETLLSYQSKIIESYRKMARDPNISNAIDIIVNEMAFTVDDEEFVLDIDEENKAIKTKISETFKKVQEILNIKENIMPICRQLYIDGQLNVALSYGKNIKDGIEDANIISPLFLYFNKDEQVWQYYEKDKLYDLYTFEEEVDETYKKEELVHVDFAMRDKVKLGENYFKVNLGYLEGVEKTLNKLNTLEDLLIPMRYSRSVSRRLFNIDVADLPPAKAKQVMDEIRSEFKYKKSYDVATGTITNMTTTHSIVEDYWMSNRSGARGTTVDTIDERGSMMDLDDIMLIGKNLYTALKIPTNRNPYADQDGGTFTYSSEADITNEELQFFLFIDRLRIPVNKLMKEILKREIISTGVLSEKEWNSYDKKIKINFKSASIFIENMKQDLSMRKIENFSNIQEHIGKIMSLETASKDILGLGTVELQEELEKIAKEKQNPIFKTFYSDNEENF